MAKYISFDFETTMNGKGRSPHPSHFENYVLTYAVAMDNDGFAGTAQPLKGTSPATMVEAVTSILLGSEADFLIGHNMKFDVEYLYHKTVPRSVAAVNLRRLIDNKMQWWDTSIAHYILTGQQDKFPTLAAALDRYSDKGLGSKSSYLDDFLTSNPEKTTEDCDFDLLTQYCKSDAELTLQLAKMQMREALVNKQFALIIAMCDALRAVTEMECNGLNLDITAYHNTLNHYQTLSESVLTDVSDLLFMLPRFTDSLEDESNLTESHRLEMTTAIINSPSTLSHILFGGSKPKAHKIVIGTTKGGLNRWGKFQINHCLGVIPDSCKKDILITASKNASGNYSVDAEMLQRAVNVCDKHMHTAEHRLLSLLIQYREFDKIVSTYLSPIIDMIRINDTIHHTLHQTSTSTGRLSASNPNFQNQPNVDIVKRIYIPDVRSLTIGGGFDKVFLEFDYKQLEVIGIAYITGDKALKRDIINGVDIHTKIGSKVYGRPPTKEERRGIKTVVFAMLYGSGIANIVKTSGLPETLVRSIVEGFKGSYPMVFKHHRTAMDSLTTIAATKKYTEHDTVYLTSKTGRKYVFPLHRNVTPTGVEYRPSWTQVCNYPCQGFATGDIVPMMLGVLLDSRKKSDYDFQLRNTVHDSILISCYKDSWMDVYKHCKEVLENPYPHLKRLFGIDDFDLPLLVEGSMGSNWGEMTPITHD
jgi:DNA polymerase I-like protein with 3'-5' exonuclease and polymerase domains